MLAILAPGQGSQTSGFLSPWLDPATSFGKTNSELVNRLSEEIGLDLTRLGTLADNDEIRSTDKAQPLLVIGGIVGALSLFYSGFNQIPHLDLPIDEIINNEKIVFAGHSVGEITAMAVAGKISSTDALSLVRERGVRMAEAAMGSETGMSAVLGGVREVVVAHLESLGLTPANENGGGQIVAAGKLSALAQLEANAPEGARVRPLAVAGAFHTSTMASAVEPLRLKASSITPLSNSSLLISNKDAALVSDASEFLNRIVGQIAGPVRWDLCMEKMKEIGVTGIIELPPAGVLAGLVKRAASEIETFALKSPDDLDEARTFVAKHSSLFFTSSISGEVK